MSTTNKLHGIQILRFIAASLVVLSHASSRGPGSPNQTNPLNPDFLGATGVVIFFIVSGFVMVHSTRGKFHTAGASLRFVKKRAFRIVPIYWIASILALAVVVLGSGHKTSCNQLNAAYLISSFLFIARARCDGQIEPILTQGWTLNFEVFFYLVFAIAMLFQRRIGITLIFVFFSVLISVGHIMQANQIISADSIIYFYMAPLMFLFVIGVFFGLLIERTGPLTLISPNVLILTGSTIGACLLIDILVPYSANDGQPHQLTWIFSSIIFVLFAFQELKFNKYVTPLLELGGDASYSIYLMHIFALLAINKIWLLLGMQPYMAAYPLLFALFGTFAALLTGVIVYELIEKPLIKRRSAPIP